MSNPNLQILITASINKGLSIGEINRKIKEIEKSGQLRAINLKLNIDKNLTNSLNNLNSKLAEIAKSLNVVSTSDQKMASTAQAATQQTNQHTAAINNQNQAMEKNAALKQKITTSPNLERTDTTTGTKFDSTTSSTFRNPSNPQEIMDKTAPIVRNINYAGQVKQNLADEAKRHSEFVKQQKKEYDLISSRDKLERSTSDQWNRRMMDRESKDKRFYDSQTQRVNNSKKLLSGVENTKATDMLARGYDKVNQRIQQMQSSGQQLTQKDISGINTRIQRLNDYSKAQIQNENRMKQMTAVINNAEKSAASFNGRFGAKKADASGITSLLTQLRAINPASKGAIASAQRIQSEITKINVEAQSAAKGTLEFGKSLQTAMVSNIAP